MIYLDFEINDKCDRSVTICQPFGNKNLRVGSIATTGRRPPVEAQAIPDSDLPTPR
jgi:hypothetical protein